MIQRQKPIPPPKLPPTVGQAIFNSLLFVVGSILFWFLVPLLIDPTSDLFSLLVFLLLAVGYPILLGYGLFLLARAFSRIYETIAVGLIYQLGALPLAFLFYLFIRIQHSPDENFTYSGVLLLSTLSIEVISISFVIYGLVKIRQRQYLP